MKESYTFNSNDIFFLGMLIDPTGPYRSNWTELEDSYKCLIATKIITPKVP